MAEHPAPGRDRGRPFFTVRLKLTLSYAGFALLAGLALCAVAFFLLHYIPVGDIRVVGPDGFSRFVPNRDDLLRALIPRAAWALAILAVVGVVGGWFLAGRMLRPVKAITQAARQAAAGSLSHRINLRGPDDELTELADTFDAMLSRLEKQVGEHERFAANASHELRTPLAVTRTLIEVAQADPSADMSVLLARLQDVNDRAVDLTESLLLLSRLDHTARVDLSQVDLALVVESAVETVSAVVGRSDVAVTVEAAPAIVRGDPVLLERLAVNLVHNAFVHNGGDDPQVWVRTSVLADGRAVLVVENTGDALSPLALATLREPFEQGMRRVRHDRGAGAGLGLAITESIARVHGAGLELRPREGGGLQARVVFAPSVTSAGR